MEDVNLYRSKLRSPNSCKSEMSSVPWESPSTSNFLGYGSVPPGDSVITPSKSMKYEILSPHKSGYFLRTPSPLKRLKAAVSVSPSKMMKIENPGTPSPQKANSATDLFGNKSLLDNLEVPEDWDENFLNNFQDDWLFGFGSEDIENLTRSPLKSPRRGLAFLNNTPKKLSSCTGLSPFKSPLLTSSPKFYNSSPAGDKITGITAGGRPLTRQRKLFLQSPEHQVPQPSHVPAAWSTPVPFPPMLDTSSSSVFSEGGLESSSIQSISSYLKNIDEEENQEDLPVMPPAGWTSKSGTESRVGKSTAKCVAKLKRGKAFTTLQNGHSGNISCHPNTIVVSQPQMIGAKKLKNEPQFTLLRPHTELHTNQISLRTTPVTPPNKIKISRDFSQIQTLPSKEQLRLVRNRFRDTLNKAVEQVIEKEKLKRGVNQQTTNLGQHTDTRHGQVQHPVSVPQQLTQASIQFSGLIPQCGITQFNVAVKAPPLKKRRR